MAKNKLIRFSSNGSISKVDRENGIIYDVSVITANREALGHELYIDETTIDQVVHLGRSTGSLGLKARFDHPSACASSMGTAIGRFKNFRKHGFKAIADLHLLDAAANSPNGNYRDYILDLAEEDPNAFATSIVFKPSEHYEPTEEELKDIPENSPFRFPHTRLESLTHCDIVDEGAANDGLFGRPDYLAEQAERWMTEKKDLVMGLLDKFLKKENMTIQAIAKENEDATFKEMESDLKMLQEKNAQLEKQVELFSRIALENEALKTELQELKSKNEIISKADEGKAAEIVSLTEKVKELSEIKLGKPVEKVAVQDTVTIGKSIKTKYQTIEEKKSLIAKWLEEEKQEQLTQK